MEAAEKYFYRAVEKLENLKECARYRDFHKVIEDHTRKALLLLYQEDGLPLLPWKAYKQGPSGYPAPGLSIGTQLSISKDTRDQVGANEVGSFAAELALYERGPIAAADEHRFAVARAPLRYGAINTLRLRHTHFGRLDLQYARLRAEAAAFDKFADIGVRNAKLHDINVEEYGAEYERVIPLYPLFDLKLRGGVKHVHRVGVVEHWPDYAQDFPVYELKPAISRFIGSDKLTLHGTYVFMAIPRLDGVAQAQLKDDDPLLKRGRAILAVNVEYAFYSPLLLPSLHLASLRPYRTPTRGFYLSAGYVSDNELYGDRRIINDTLFGGARLEGPGAWDIGITESWYRGRGRDIKLEGEVAAPDLSGSSLRTTVVLKRRLVNPDATPGVPEAYGPFAPDTLNVVFPASYDHVLTGDRSLENFRVGAQLWWKVFGTGLWGTTALMTVGYDYQYFYRFGEHAHNVAARLRIGWGDL